MNRRSFLASAGLAGLSRPAVAGPAPPKWPAENYRRYSVDIHVPDCGHQTSVTAGTIFQDTRTPLSLWFQAMWRITWPGPAVTE
jgi:hypothetical protein